MTTKHPVTVEELGILLKDTLDQPNDTLLIAGFDYLYTLLHGDLKQLNALPPDANVELAGPTFHIKHAGKHNAVLFNQYEPRAWRVFGKVSDIAA